MHLNIIIYGQFMLNCSLTNNRRDHVKNISIKGQLYKIWLVWAWYISVNIYPDCVHTKRKVIWVLKKLLGFPDMSHHHWWHPEHQHIRICECRTFDHIEFAWNIVILWKVNLHGVLRCEINTDGIQGGQWSRVNIHKGVLCHWVPIRVLQSSKEVTRHWNSLPNIWGYYF